MKNNQEYHISYRTIISFFILTAVMALFSNLMFFDASKEYPIIVPYLFTPVTLALWYVVNCLLTCFSGIMIRPLFSPGRSDSLYFVFIWWSYWIILGCIVCVFVTAISIVILISNGYYWLENFVRLIESVIVLGIPYSLFIISLFILFAVTFCPKVLALKVTVWLVGTLFLAVSCIGTGVTFVYIMSKI